MSEYDNTMESDGYRCPYCGVLDIFEDWSGDYDGEECECGCGKKFIATAETSVDYYAKPDCTLNGETHKYEFYGKVDSGKDAYFCETCGGCRIGKEQK